MREVLALCRVHVSVLPLSQTSRVKVSKLWNDTFVVNQCLRKAVSKLRTKRPRFPPPFRQCNLLLIRFSMENWRISGAHLVACSVYIELLRSAGTITSPGTRVAVQINHVLQTLLDWGGWKEVAFSCIGTSSGRKSAMCPSTSGLLSRSFSTQGAFACLHLAGGYGVVPTAFLEGQVT